MRERIRTGCPAEEPMRSQEYLLQRARQAAQEAPFAVVLGALSKSREDARRLSSRYRLSREAEKRTEDVAILRRDHPERFWDDFLPELQSSIQLPEEKTMKTVWSAQHYLDAIIAQLKKLVDLEGFSVSPSRLKQDSAHISILPPTTHSGTTFPLLRIEASTWTEQTQYAHSDRRFLRVLANEFGLLPVKIHVAEPASLALARKIGGQWQRRIPPSIRTQESVLIVKDF